MENQPDSPSRRKMLAGAAVAAAVACKRTPALQVLDHVRVHRVEGALPRDDPGASTWDFASEHEGSLAPQNIVAPMLQQPSVNRVKVRALHDGSWVAFRLNWADSAGDILQGPSRFCDAAAVQVPRDPRDEPSVMMGHPNAAVRILLWKAAWQVPDMVGALHPNRPPPFYPFEAAQGEARATMEQQYGPARNVHNPNLHRPLGVPVVLAEAEQFGSLTGLQAQSLAGRGVYAEGRWSVVLASPFESLGTAVRPGRESKVAFALWEGAAKNVGARKMRSEQWIRMVLA